MKAYVSILNLYLLNIIEISLDSRLHQRNLCSLYLLLCLFGIIKLELARSHK